MLATFNNTIVATGFSLAFYQLIKWRGNSCGYELPSFSTTIIDFLAFLIFDEIGIYYTHRYIYILQNNLSLSKVVDNNSNKHSIALNYDHYWFYAFTVTVT